MIVFASCLLRTTEAIMIVFASCLLRTTEVVGLKPRRFCTSLASHTVPWLDMARARGGWEGSLEISKKALGPLLAKGKLEYGNAPADPIDEKWIVEHVPELIVLFQEIPKGNGKYSMFVRTILSMMKDGEYGRGCPHLHNHQLVFV